MTKETVYIGLDQPNTAVFKTDGSAIDFSNINRMLVTFVNSSVVADSDVDSTLFDWMLGNGKIQFNFNHLPIPTGKYRCTFKVFDSLHPNGQALAHPTGEKLYFEFVE